MAGEGEGVRCMGVRIAIKSSEERGPRLRNVKFVAAVVANSEGEVDPVTVAVIFVSHIGERGRVLELWCFDYCRGEGLEGGGGIEPGRTRGKCIPTLMTSMSKRHRGRLTSCLVH